MLECPMTHFKSVVGIFTWLITKCDLNNFRIYKSSSIIHFRLVKWLDSKLIPRLLEIFEFLKNFYAILFRFKNDANKPNFIPQIHSRAEKSAKVKSNFQRGITFSKMIFFKNFFLYLYQHENLKAIHQNQAKIFLHSRVIVKILFLEHRPLYLPSIDIITDYSYINIWNYRF